MGNLFYMILSYRIICYFCWNPFSNPSQSTAEWQPDKAVEISALLCFFDKRRQRVIQEIKMVNDLLFSNMVNECK